MRLTVSCNFKRYNHLSTISEVCSNVEIEPHFQPITSEHLYLKTANKEQAAHLGQGNIHVQALQSKLGLRLRDTYCERISYFLQKIIFCEIYTMCNYGHIQTICMMT